MNNDEKATLLGVITSLVGWLFLIWASGGLFGPYGALFATAVVMMWVGWRLMS